MTDEQLEQMLALDAAQGPALPIDAAHADAIVQAALVGAGFGPPPSGGSTTSGGGTTIGANGARMATGTKLAIVGGAAVAVVVVALILAGRRAPRQEMAAITPDAAVDAPSLGSGSATPDTTIDEAAITIEPTPKRPTHTEKRSEKHTEKPAEKKTVDDLLGEANAKRAEKEWRDSDLLYGRVVDKAPKSLAAQTALVASGSLHLEHLRDPRGAAKRFRRALELAPSGGVAEDARWGLAEALRALHDDKGEAAALDDFLAHHASSPLASRARARRAELP
jgi:hypothetical protein